MVHFKTWILFVRTIISFALSPKGFSKYSLAGKTLFSLTFRYPDKSKHSFGFFLKKYLEALTCKRIMLNDACHKYTSGDIFFYDNDSSVANEKARKGHIEFFLKHPVNGSIWKDKLLAYFSLSDKFLQLLFETLLFIFLLPLTLFAEYEGSLGMIFIEYIELVNLIKIVKKEEVNTLYYYSIYEKDSNISSIALQNMGVRVNKITSLTPLKFWNSIIVAADKLILCDMNQLDEVDEYKSTIQVDAIEVWGPETIAGSAAHYFNGGRYDTNKNVIGFYSTAAYMRAMQGDVDHKNSARNENLVKSYLAEYLRANRAKKLIVFPHPREKRAENKRLVEDHYNSFFNGLSFTIYDSELPSSLCFDAVDLGIAMYSSVIYERLYFGFKCLMMPGEEGLELPGKALSYICARSKEDLFAKADMFSDLTVLEYFKKTGLKQSPFMVELLNTPHSK